MSTPLASSNVFPDWATPLREATNASVEALVVGFGGSFEGITQALLALLVALERALRGAPPLSIIVAAALLGWWAGRRWQVALGVAVGLWLIGALGQWDAAMQTLALVLVAVALALVIGLPLGVAAARGAPLRRALLPLLDLMQTLPSFVYLIPAAMLFGLGKVPALLATVVVAVPPLVRLTELGLSQVSREVRDAGTSLGATRWQLLVRVQLPLALPSILRGLNQATLMALSMVVIASMIGARGVGETVLVGLQRSDPGLGLVGGLVIVILAVVLDRTLQAGGRRLGARAR